MLFFGTFIDRGRRRINGKNSNTRKRQAREIEKRRLEKRDKVVGRPHDMSFQCHLDIIWLFGHKTWWLAAASFTSLFSPHDQKVRALVSKDEKPLFCKWLMSSTNSKYKGTF